MMKMKGLFGEVEIVDKKHTASHKRRYKDYGENWSELSALCLRLANNLCQDCGHTEATNAHHITPLSKGGANALFNLRALCYHCHARYHQHMGRRKTDTTKLNANKLF